jgi:ABC-type transporter Mla MlaB component
MAEIRRRQNGDRVVLTVSGELTVSHMKALKAELIDALKGADSVEVALGQVAAIDITFAQLLCSAERTAAGLQKRVMVTGVEQERFGAMLRSAGFTRHVGCQEGARRSCLWLHNRVSE